MRQHCTPARGRRARSIAWAVVALVACGAPTVAWAQRLDPSQVQMELERTDAMLQRAREVVEASGDPRARDQLRFALGTQAMAWNHFRQTYYRLALDATLRARDLGGRAVRLAQQQVGLEQRARRVVEDAARALERAQTCGGDRPSDSQRRMLDLARQQLVHAQEALHAMRWEIARGLGGQVLQTVRLVCGDVACPRVEQMIESVAQLYERAARDLPPDDRRGRDDLERARTLLERGRESLRRGACEPAFMQVRQARDLVLRLMRDRDDEPQAAMVEQVIEATSADVDELGPRIDDDAARALLDSARRHLDRARDLHRAARLRAALAETRVARNLAWRAARMAGLEGF
jgi:hypothetical protein